jgi:hypothetical protein
MTAVGKLPEGFTLVFAVSAADSLPQQGERRLGVQWFEGETYVCLNR